MSWIAVYLEIALCVALVCFVVLTSVAAALTGDRAAAVAVAAIAWPILLVGLAELLVIVTARNPPLPGRRRGEAPD
jgi:hypothetical protein